jgi:hypothetical protein
MLIRFRRGLVVSTAKISRMAHKLAFLTVGVRHESVVSYKGAHGEALKERKPCRLDP